MNLEGLINRLSELNYAMGNFQNSTYYKLNKHNEVKLAIYVRRSRGDKKAVDNQLASIMYIVEDEFGIDKRSINTYIDNGFSGTSGIRPAYLNLKTALEEERVNTIVVANIDRLGRTTEVLLEDIYPNQKINHLFIALDNKLINGLRNRSIILKKSEQADAYAAECSEKSRRGIKAKMKNQSVISSKAPFGYSIVNIGSKRKYVLGNSSDIQVVKDIYSMYLQGRTIGEIANILTKQGVKTPSKKSRWGRTTVESILKNVNYVGELQQGRYQKQGYSNDGSSKEIMKVDKENWIYGGEHTPIIDKEIFDMVQERLYENKSTRNRNGEYKLFSGLIKCGECGKALVYRNKIKSYQCSTNLKNYTYSNEFEKCTSHLISEADLKEVINNKIYEIINKSLNAKVHKKILKEIGLKTSNKALIGELEYIDDEIKKHLREIIEIKKNNVRYSEIIIKDLEHKIEGLINSKEDILKRIDLNDEHRARMKSIFENISKYNVEDNRIYKLFIKQIRVYEEYKIEIDWRC